MSELSVVMLCLAIVGGTLLYLNSGVAGYNQGVRVSQDLRLMMVAQKKAILNGLYSPAGLSGYNSGALWLTESSLKTEGLLTPALYMDTLGGVSNGSTIPPTYSWDGSGGWFTNVAKDPLRADSGDGLYDVGPEY